MRGSICDHTPGKCMVKRSQCLLAFPCSAFPDLLQVLARLVLQWCPRGQCAAEYAPLCLIHAANSFQSDSSGPSLKTPTFSDQQLANVCPDPTCQQRSRRDLQLTPQYLYWGDGGLMRGGDMAHTRGNMELSHEDVAHN